MGDIGETGMTKGYILYHLGYPIANIHDKLSSDGIKAALKNPPLRAEKDEKEVRKQ